MTPRNATAAERARLRLGPAAPVVTRILSRLKAEGIKAVVAGGYPRDFVFGVEPRDIDLYVSCRDFTNAERVLYDKDTIKSPQYLDGSSAEYEHQYVQMQVEHESALSPGHPINLIGLRWDYRVKAPIVGAEIVSRFNVSLSQVWFELGAGDQLALGWSLRFASDAGKSPRRITVLRDDWGHAATAKTVRKLLEKYPDCEVRMADGRRYDEAEFLASASADPEPL